MECKLPQKNLVFYIGFHFLKFTWIYTAYLVSVDNEVSTEDGFCNRNAWNIWSFEEKIFLNSENNSTNFTLKSKHSPIDQGFSTGGIFTPWGKFYLSWG